MCFHHAYLHHAYLNIAAFRHFEVNFTKADLVSSRPFSMHSSLHCCCVSPLMKQLNHSPRDCLLVAATLNANEINRRRAACCCLRHLTASHSQCFPNEPCIWTHLRPTSDILEAFAQSATAPPINYIRY